jgi:phosphotransferase system enzyme I (PtsI)
VVRGLEGNPITIRTLDIGADKYPSYLHLPKEENPFLGWRAIRVCLDEPRLFRAQLRALLRASDHGDVRIMLPLVNDVVEITRTRELMDESLAELAKEGRPVERPYVLGAMIETPAAALAAPELARHVDFFSIGTNDLVQYTLAVDRGNSRLASRYNPFHPSVVRLLDAVVRSGREAGLEVSVCGELAAHPLGAFMLIGMGVHSLSVGPSALAEIKKVIRSVNQEKGRLAVADALAAASPMEVVEVLSAHARDDLELSRFTGPWSLSRPA